MACQVTGAEIDLNLPVKLYSKIGRNISCNQELKYEVNLVPLNIHYQI